ncbi:hypothetical protein KM043_016499 [Ampulex compressa]|nr:hypothetical protein KM043_016499 [Ampulex compressa]
MIERILEEGEKKTKEKGKKILIWGKLNARIGNGGCGREKQVDGEREMRSRERKSKNKVINDVREKMLKCLVERGCSEEGEDDNRLRSVVNEETREEVKSLSVEDRIDSDYLLLTGAVKEAQDSKEGRIFAKIQDFPNSLAALKLK